MIVSQDSCSLVVTTHKSADFSFTVALSKIVRACVASFAKVMVFLAKILANS